MAKKKHRKPKSSPSSPRLEPKETGRDLVLDKTDGESSIPSASDTSDVIPENQAVDTDDITSTKLDIEERFSSETQGNTFTVQLQESDEAIAGEDNEDHIHDLHKQNEGDGKGAQTQVDEEEDKEEQKEQKESDEQREQVQLLMERLSMETSEQKQEYDVEVTAIDPSNIDKEDIVSQEDHEQVPHIVADNLSEGEEAKGGEGVTMDNQDIVENQDRGSTCNDTKVSEGPYSLLDLIDNIPVINPEAEGLDDSVITYLEAWDKNLYIGTSKGELIHMFKIDEEMGYIVVSRQPFSNSKMKSIDKILLLPELSKALVLSGSVVMAYVLPEFSPANIGKMKDVTDMSIDYDDLTLDETQTNRVTHIEEVNGEVYIKVTVFTKKSIRLIRVFNHSIKLFKDVHYPQSLVGAQRSNFAAVSSAESYDLIDLTNVQRIPLFPLSTVTNKSTLNPIVLPLGKDEFIMCCGGSDESDNAMGMVVNINGDISRGTIPWDSYPSSLVVDFPFSIGVFDSGRTIITHSSLDQSEVQKMEFPEPMSVRVQSVSHIFDSKNDQLKEILLKSPLVSTGSVEESEMVVMETDKIQSNVHVFSSTVVYDIHGKNIKILQSLPTPMRLVNIFNSATADNYRSVNQSLVEELKETGNSHKSDQVSKLLRELIYSMLGILALKFQVFDQCFEIWCNPQSDLDPRLVIYMILGKDASIFGSLWQFEYLFPAFNEVRDFYSCLKDRRQVDEFNTVFLNTWVSNSDFIKDPEILKSLEMSLIKSEIAASNNENDVLETLRNIKVCQKEIKEYLHHEKKYYLIAKYYESLEDHRQFLYYWSCLIKGEFKDEYYEKNFTKEKSLQFFINYAVKYCSKDETTIWKYGEWLISDYPEFGIKLFVSPALDKMQINDLKILQSLDKHPSMKSSYLEYMLKKKNEKQFIGDYILELLKTLLNDIEPVLDELSELIARYSKLDSPKMTYLQFLKIQKNKFVKPEVLDLEIQLYQYLLLINDETVSIVDRKNVISEVSKAVEPFQSRLPLLRIVLSYKKQQNQQVVEQFCELFDFASAERFANTLKLSEELNSDYQLTESEKSESESLLLVIFDFYLKLENGTLIENFLNNHNIITSSETFDSKDGSNTANKIQESMDRFIFLLNRLPNNFPIAQIQNFLINNMINFENRYTDTLLQKNLAKSQNSLYTKCLQDFGNSAKE